jgi:hypothetical protein
MDAPISISREAFREPLHGLDQPGFEVTWYRLVSVRRPMLPQHTAGATLGNPMLLHQESDRGPPLGQAHQLPRFTSFNIEMSKACSATIRFKREFSRSRAFKR